MTDKTRIEANIKEWLAWLRGEREPIEQTNGVLRKNDSFCCLGVACDKVLSIPSTLLNTNPEVYKYYNNTEVLPDKAIHLLGLHDSIGTFSFISPEYENEQIYATLADLNDDGLKNFSYDPILSKLNLPKTGKATFKIIAQIIAAKPTDLFREDYYIA